MTTLWHEIECGAYAADLPLWEELATETARPILDLGCGTGRVAIHLARLGHETIGLDIAPALVDAFNEQAEALPARASVGDGRDFDLGREFGLILAPMQLVQLLDGGSERTECLQRVRDHLRDDGLAAFAIVEELPEPVEGPPPLPDAREVDGWVYSSLPLETAIGDGRMVVRRLRQTVSPRGELSDELDEVSLQVLAAATLELEAEAVGLQPAGRRAIAATAEHVGSTVLLLRKGT